MAPHLIFRSIQHRDQVLEVIIEALEQLEETLEEELNLEAEEAQEEDIT